LAVVELPLELRVRALRARDDHETARAGIEPMHDALPLRSAARRDPSAEAGERTDHRRALPAHGRVRGDTGRLVDDDEVIVLEDDADALDDLRNDLRLSALRPFDLQPGTSPQTIRFAECG